MSTELKCTNAEWLFKVPRLWSVPNYLVDNRQYAEVIGRRSTGSAIVDRKMAGDMTPIHAFTSQIADVLEEGHRLMPCDEETAIITFQVVTDHIIDWANYLKRERLIERQIPVIGLRKFSNLSAELIRIARADDYHRKLNIRRSFFANLRGEKHEDQLAVYNSNMIDFIESQHRKRSGQKRMSVLGGEDFEKRRF